LTTSGLEHSNGEQLLNSHPAPRVGRLLLGIKIGYKLTGTLQTSAKAGKQLQSQQTGSSRQVTRRAARTPSQHSRALLRATEAETICKAPIRPSKSSRDSLSHGCCAHTGHTPIFPSVLQQDSPEIIGLPFSIAGSSRHYSPYHGALQRFGKKLRKRQGKPQRSATRLLSGEIHGLEAWKRHHHPFPPLSTMPHVPSEGLPGDGALTRNEFSQAHRD